MPDRIFGAIPGIVEGVDLRQPDRAFAFLVHRPRQAGISGFQLEGADSIVLSGGSKDELDYGNVIVYTGQGGRSLATGKQVTDQDLVREILALAISCQRGLPVRVIRGQHHLSTNAGLYAEAAHIQPLGTPHNGPDILGNILCLCPNHHVSFDYGGFTVSDNWALVGEGGRLHVHPKHSIGQAFLAYHRLHRYDGDW